MNFVDPIALNNNIEKIKYYRNLLLEGLTDIEETLTDLDKSYRSRNNDISHLTFKSKVNNKRIILCETHKIEFLTNKLDSYKKANSKANNILGG